MILNISILHIILNISFVQYVKASQSSTICNSDQYETQFFTIQKSIKNQVNQYQTKENIRIGQGFWFNYRPLDFQQSNNYQEIDTSQTIINLFLYRLQRQNKIQETLIFNYIELDQKNLQISIVFYVLTQSGYKKSQIKIFDKFSLDGDWKFIYFHIDQEKKILNSYYYQNYNEKYEQLVIEEFCQIEVNDSLYSSIGFLINEKFDGYPIKTYQCLGIYYGLIVSEENLFLDYQNFLSNCVPKSQCTSRRLNLISYNKYFSGFYQISTQTDQLSNNYYKISGWVKQEKLSNSMKLDSLLLRITTNQYFFDDNQIGDKLLYVLYYQNQVLSQNGFTFQTYSYDFPIKQSSYTTQLNDIIYTISSEYAEIQTDWHFFYYIEGSIEKQGQPFIRIYYPKKEKTFDFQWKKDIHHYTNVKLFFHFGGDDYIQNQFKGYLSDWKIEIYCQPKFEITVDIPCHYSCLTCKGIFENDCLSCDSESKRIFSNDENKCVCPIPYIDISQQNCQLLQNVDGIFTYKEIQIPTNKSVAEWVCEFGYFLYNTSCIKCPHYDELQSNFWILCPDCYIFPTEFSANKQCSFNFISKNEKESYIYQENGYIDFQAYLIKQDDQKNYFLQLQQGIYFLNGLASCKPGYTMSKDNQCESCPLGCSYCFIKNKCFQCAIGYYMINNNLCEPCKMCHACEYDNGEEFCYYEDNCVQSQYWFNNKCYDCGENCLTCSVDQCFQCIDNQKYYLTLDKINCALCPIQNCKYCFEYFMSNQGIIVSFDIDSFQKYSRAQLKIIVGCAQCSDGFFYSQQTQECILRPINQKECSVGFIYNQLKDPICLKSLTLLNSIQSVYCNNNAYCLECIKYYSQSLQSFCIVCQEGYYSTILTGQCKLCPVGCRTCAQQLKVFQDFWKWEIKAFYKLFVNSDGFHSFEENAANLDQNQYEIICLSCSSNQILYKNSCIDGCDENCIDCIVQQDYYTFPPYSKCIRCKQTIYNKQRSLQIISNATQIVSQQCLQCALYCEACFPRSETQIKFLNPFFDLTTNYKFHSNLCYKYNIDQISFMHPKFFIPQRCQNFERCQKTLQINFMVFCSNDQFYQEYFQSVNEKIRDRFLQFYNMMVISPMIKIEKKEIFDYLNNDVIEQILFQFAFQPIKGQIGHCFIDSKFSQKLLNNLRQYVFYLNFIKLEIYGENTIIPYYLSKSLQISNFDHIIFRNFNFLTPQQNIRDPTANITCYININNPYIPIILEIINCNFTSPNANDEAYVVLEMKSNNPKKILFNQVELMQLKIKDSNLYNFQPYIEDIQSDFIVNDYKIRNCIFQNTSIFSFQAVQKSLKYIIRMTSVSIYDTKFINSTFIDSLYKFSFDIGSIYLENFYLENVYFEQNSKFLYILSSQNTYLKNFTLKQVNFTDNSSFLITNTFYIESLLIMNCEIDNGFLITNNGDLTQSDIVLKNSRYLKLKNIVFDNIQYKSEKTLIYITQKQINSLEVSIFYLSIINCKQQNYQPRSINFNRISYEFSLIYLECTYCYLSDITIIRGYGRPEISIVQSQDLIIKNLYITLKEQYYQKSLHSAYKCIQQSEILDMPFVIFINSYHKLFFDGFKIEKLLIYDYQIIIIEGQSQSDVQIFQNHIHITNAIFLQNVLIITQLYKSTAIIAIYNQQNNSVLIENIIFSNNLLNKYEEDTQLHSSSTILIEFQVGEVLLKNLTFYQNVIYNSTDSILYIKTSSLILDHCTFQGSNIFNTMMIKNNILLQQLQDIDLNSTLQNIFSVQSYGGSGQFLVNQLEILNTTVNNTQAVNGGGFYIITGSKGIINIINSEFSLTQTLLSANLFSSGGALYIDSSKSQLNLQISNCLYNRSFSLSQGGAIYIDPSKISNKIQINLVNFISCFSFQYSIISFMPSQLQSLSSSMSIVNSNFQNLKVEYEFYISQIQDFPEMNTDQIKLLNPLIYSQFSNVTIQNCKFQQIYLANLIQIEKGLNIILDEIIILDCLIFFESLIKISHRENIQSSLILQNIQIINTNDFQFDFQYNCIEKKQQTLNELICPSLTDKGITFDFQISDYYYNQTNNIYCIQQYLNSQIKSQFSLVSFSGLQNMNQVKIDKIKIQNTKCEICQFGLINIQYISNNKQYFSLSNLDISNNNCGYLGCLSIFQEFSKSIFNDSNVRILKESKKELIEFDLLFKVNIKIEESNFLNNTASYGAACFFAQVNVLILNCFFENNFAFQKGGAIYFYSNDNQIQLVNSQIVDNNAQIAGGIYTVQTQIQQKNNWNFFFDNNNGIQHVDNLQSIPCNLVLKINGIKQNSKNQIKNKTTIIDIINIEAYSILGQNKKSDILLFPSGIALSKYRYFDAFSSMYIPYNFTLRLIASNQQNEQIYNLEGSKCKIFSEIIENQRFNFQDLKIQEEILSQSSIKFDSNTGDYNLDDLIIYFNPKTDDNLQLQIAFQCDSIKVPQYNPNYPYELQNIIDNYILVLKLKTFECQLGEYLNVTSGGCVQCDVQQNQYSITKDAIQCEYKDELKMKNITSAMIELREGFWRAFYDSRIVEECYHLKLNCLGGWIAGDPSCNIGHIGALCEQCDIYNIKGLGSYSQSQNYSCSNCTEMAKNIITIILAFIWTLLSIFLSVNSTIKMIDEFIIYTKLRTFGKFLIFQVDSISILIKVFTNYLQIISSLSTFQLAIPIGITLSFQSIGNPIESMSFSLDCYFVQFTELEIIYTRILWAFVQVGIFISIFLIIHIILLLINNQKMSLTFVTTTLIYIYIYLSPNLLSGLISLMSYRTISNEKWITSNVSYLYNTDQHLKWLLYLILPVFLLISIILPFFFFGILYYHRAKLNQTKIRQIWGYLYNEYKDETYFWEIIKIIQKELIILVLIYYVDYVSIKSSLIFFILHLYGILTNKYKPYQNGDLNQIDSFQTSVCKASIILAQTIYSAQNLDLVEITGPFYVILTIMNLFFVIKIITKLFFAYFDKLHLQIDSLKTLILIRCPSFFTKQRQCQKLLINSSERKQIIRQRFLLIKAYLLLQARQIISYKKLNNLDFNSLRTNKDISRIYQQSIINQNKAIRLNTNLNTSRTSKILTSIQQQEI